MSSTLDMDINFDSADVDDLTDLVEAIYNRRIQLPATSDESASATASEPVATTSSAVHSSPPATSSTTMGDPFPLELQYTGQEEGHPCSSPTYPAIVGVTTLSRLSPNNFPETIDDSFQSDLTFASNVLYGSRGGFPDLSTIDYSVPLQMLDQPQVISPKCTAVTLEPLEPLVERHMSRLGPGRSSSVRYSEFQGQTRKLGNNSPRRQSDISAAEVSQQKRRRFDPEIGFGEPDSRIKQEICLSPEHLSSPSLSSQSSPHCAMNTIGGNATAIKFSPFMEEKWAKISTSKCKEIPRPNLIVLADKGFNFSVVDDAFIVQKKNHFQLSCIIQMCQCSKYVLTRDKHISPITSYRLNFYGVKSDAPFTKIKVEQSQADRTKRTFYPMDVNLGNDIKPDHELCDDAHWEDKLTACRLHFAETTSNNMRKKGKPNPAQKYFRLVVGLEAISGNEIFDIVMMASEKIIVRASNPGQFESEAEATWSRDQGGDTIYHMGKVGINCDQSSEALTIHGNMQITGQILQPSDMRIKRVLREINPKEQLENLKQLKIVEYQYKPEFEETLSDGQSKAVRSRTGVIAQDVLKVIPDAVETCGPYRLRNGEVIKDLMIVDKERLFLENIGAVNELNGLTVDLRKRVDILEKATDCIATQLTRIARGSITLSTCSASGLAMFAERNRKKFQPLYEYRWVQCLLIFAVALMAFSAFSGTVLYFVKHQQEAPKEDGYFFLGKNASNFLLNDESSSSTQKIQNLNTPVIGSLSQEVLILCSKNGATGCIQHCCSSPADIGAPLLLPYTASNDKNYLRSIGNSSQNSFYSQNNSTKVITNPQIISTTSTERPATSDEQVVNQDLISLTIIQKDEQLLREVKEISDDKKNRLKEPDIENFSSTNETFNTVEPQLDDDQEMKPGDDSEEESDKKLPAALIDSHREASGSVEPRSINFTESVVVHTPITKVKVDTTWNNDHHDEARNEVGDVEPSKGADEDEDTGNAKDSSDIHHRFKREHFHLLHRVVRDTENDPNGDGGSLFPIQTTPNDSKIWPTLETISAGNFTLNEIFCDKDDELYETCTSTLNWSKAKLAVPLSKYFKDEVVILRFSGPQAVAMCLAETEGHTCQKGNRESEEQRDFSVVTSNSLGSSNSTFIVTVSLYPTMEVRFRLANTTGLNPQSICNESQKNLANSFRELTIKFYRVCEQ